MPKTDEFRYDRIGKIRLLTRVEGYVVAKRPRCTPFVVLKDRWEKLSLKPMELTKSA